MTIATKRRTRIQAQNEQRIIAAALDIFAANGYRGATVDQIALAADMSKANVLYYFSRKEEIYLAVLEHTVGAWLDPLVNLRAAGDPLEELGNYIELKLNMSRDAPAASRLFANEILHGAGMVKDYLEDELKPLVKEKCKVIQSWIDRGLIADISPLHLLFLIWSSTQHYADFAPQIDVLCDDSKGELYDDALATLKTLLLRGLAGPNYTHHGDDKTTENGVTPL